MKENRFRNSRSVLSLASFRNSRSKRPRAAACTMNCSRRTSPTAWTDSPQWRRAPICASTFVRRLRRPVTTWARKRTRDAGTTTWKRAMSYGGRTPRSQFLPPLNMVARTRRRAKSNHRRGRDEKVYSNGKYVDTDRHIVRGAVGQTSTGGYKSAEVHVSLELDNGRVSGSRESWKWNGKVHPEKDQAILASCEAVEHIV